MNRIARGNTPFFSSRLPLDYLKRLDHLAMWLHETRGFRLSRRVALEYLIDRYWYSPDNEAKDHDVSAT
jgi:hypothetical protein